MLLREAVNADAAGIAVIYNDAVLTSTAIWTGVTSDAADRAKWLAEKREQAFPVLIAEGEDGAIDGYATFGPWREKEGYRHTVEHSVYVHKDRRGTGIGKALMVELIKRADALGKHVMIAGIEASNTESIALHERLGFERAGYVKEVGTKFDKWLDLVFMQLLLSRPAP